MSTSDTGQRELAHETARQHIEQLLEHYPAITVPEEQEIVRFLRKGPIIDVGMVTSNEALQAKLARFRADHKADFSMRGRDLVVFAVLLVAFVLACWLLWDAGTTR